MTRSRAALGALLLALAALAGCAPVPLPTFPATAASAATGAGPDTIAVTPPAAHTGLAIDVLTELPVKGRAPKTGYSRDQFGKGWADADGNGCDTRAEILARDALTDTLRGGCVDTITILDPYSGKRLDGRPAIDIDHVVALGDAWVKGAQYPGVDAADATERRVSLANDPLNLLAVSDKLNRQKSDADAATWLPPNVAYRCAYVARQVAVKAKYGLWVTDAERAAIARVLGACPTEPLPEEGSAP